MPVGTEVTFTNLPTSANTHCATQFFEGRFNFTLAPGQSAKHIFDTPGEFRVVFKLKQKNKVVGSGTTTVRVRPGVRDGDEIIR